MISIIIFALSIGCSQPNTDTIISKVAEKGSDNYEEDLESYKRNEFWTLWSMRIGSPSASSSLKEDGEIKYSPEKLSDYDLNTAWIPSKKNDYGIGDSFEFVFHFPNNTSYAGAYQFFGICNVFNGYCKTIELWKANSRIKKLKVYYNNTPICFVELKDSWHFQSFDIGKYFINRRDKKYLDAAYEIVDGDKLKFEIVEVYPGEKYKDVAISEFLCKGAGN